MLERVRRVDLRSEVPVIIENTESDIVNLNQEQLYLSGMDADGEQLDEYRNSEYAEMKAGMNPNPGTGIPDLNLTGAFYRSMKVDIGSNEFYIDATDEKTSWLKERYGERIFGFTEDSRRRYATGVFFEQLKLYIETVTGLKFS